MSYAAVELAIRKRASLTAKYENYIRYFSPHVIGTDAAGNSVVLAFQYLGGKPGGLEPGGEWCVFRIAGLEVTEMNSDEWHSGDHKQKPGDWLVSVDIAA